MTPSAPGRKWRNPTTVWGLTQLSDRCVGACGSHCPRARLKMATARARKREAVAELRSLAVDRGLAVNRRSADLSAAAFEALAAAVLAAGGRLHFLPLHWHGTLCHRLLAAQRECALGSPFQRIGRCFARMPLWIILPAMPQLTNRHSRRMTAASFRSP